MIGKIVLCVQILLSVKTSAFKWYTTKIKAAASLKAKTENAINQNSFNVKRLNNIEDDVIQRPTRALIVDNYDSYTFNIWQILAEVNQRKPDVIYNDNLNCLQRLRQNNYNEYDCIILSPGPGSVEHPDDFGICKDIILESPIPVLGVCLGHQGIAYTFGGHIQKAPQPIHGRIWNIHHTQTDLFTHIPNQMDVTRYHSLIVADENQGYELPECLEVTARTNDGIIMALQHKTRPLYGVQFHPESIGTKYGKQLFQNFRDITTQYTAKKYTRTSNYLPYSFQNITHNDLTYMDKKSTSISTSTSTSTLKKSIQKSSQDSSPDSIHTMLTTPLKSSISSEPDHTKYIDQNNLNINHTVVNKRRKRHIYVSSKISLRHYYEYNQQLLHTHQRDQIININNGSSHSNIGDNIDKLIFRKETTTSLPFYPDPIEYIFFNLFGDKNMSFWLDNPTTFLQPSPITSSSSSLQSSSSSSSSSSYSDVSKLKTSNSNRKDESTSDMKDVDKLMTNTYSYMGCLNTHSKHDYAIEYYGNNDLYQRHIKDNTVTHINQNIFEYIHNEIQKQDELFDIDIIHNTEQPHNTTMSTSIISTKSQMFSDINMENLKKGRMLFGYLSYEARHESTYILQSGSKSIHENTDNTNTILPTSDSFTQLYNMSCTQDPEYVLLRQQIEKTYQNNTMLWNKVPIGVYMIPSSYIMINHQDHSMFIITIEDDDDDDSNSDSDNDSDSDSKSDDKHTKGAHNLEYDEISSSSSGKSSNKRLYDQVKQTLQEYEIENMTPLLSHNSGDSIDTKSINKTLTSEIISTTTSIDITGVSTVEHNNSEESTATDFISTPTTGTQAKSQKIDINTSIDNKDKSTTANNQNKEFSSEGSSKRLYSSMSKHNYYNNIKTCLDHIQNGESYELCLTMKFTGSYPTHIQNHHHTQNAHNAHNAQISMNRQQQKLSKNHPLYMYQTLRRKNTASYSSFLHYYPPPSSNSFSITEPQQQQQQQQQYHMSPIRVPPLIEKISLENHGFTVCCSSPERYLKITQDGYIESKPIKGTAKRNLTDIIQDNHIAMTLKNDEKTRAENLMIVDLVRNDLGRVCDIESVYVPKLMNIETYTTVHQLVSTIRGKLSSNRTVADALIATFPGGSMTGAPKKRTMDLIHDLENQTPRSIYSGTIGYINTDGTADLNIVIRTVLLANNMLTIGAGGAIVAMSDPQKEVDEVILKAQAVSNAIGYDLSFTLDNNNDNNNNNNNSDNTTSDDNNK